MSTWRICRIGQTDIRLHPAMLLYIIYAMLIGHGRFMMIAVASILLHETAHAGVSAILGQIPASIELSPLGAVMRLEDDNRLPPVKRSMMLIAGPATTFLLCVAAMEFAKRGVIPQQSVGILFMTNLSILLLNMLPVLPLDGGRLLSLVLSCLLKPHVVGRIMRWIGTVVGMGLIMLNIWSSYRLGTWNLSLAFIGCCMIYSAVISTMTQAMAELRFLMERKIILERKGQSPSKQVMALHTQTLRQLLQAISAYRLCQFIVIEAGTMNNLGMLTEFDVISAYLQEPNMRCGRLLNPDKIEHGKK